MAITIPPELEPMAAISPVVRVGLKKLAEDVQQNNGLVPFVGAGLSRGVTMGRPEAERYPEWGELLRSIVNDETYIALFNQDRKNKIEGYLKNNQYELASEEIFGPSGLTGDQLMNQLEARFTELPSPSELSNSGLLSLPLLARGPVITTNFDEMLETLFAERDHPITARAFGGRFITTSVSEMRADTPILIKLHGHWREPENLVLLRSDYEREYDLVYTVADPDHPTCAFDKPLPKLLRQIFLQGRMPLLFMGCSMKTDRTIHVLRALNLPNAGGYYCLIGFPPAEERIALDKLLSELHIRPLYYPAGRHDFVGKVLDWLAGFVTSPDRTDAKADKDKLVNLFDRSAHEALCIESILKTADHRARLVVLCAEQSAGPGFASGLDNRIERCALMKGRQIARNSYFCPAQIEWISDVGPTALSIFLQNLLNSAGVERPPNEIRSGENLIFDNERWKGEHIYAWTKVSHQDFLRDLRAQLVPILSEYNEAVHRQGLGAHSAPYLTIFVALTVENGKQPPRPRVFLPPLPLMQRVLTRSGTHYELVITVYRQAWVPQLMRPLVNPVSDPVQRGEMCVPIAYIHMDTEIDVNEKLIGAWKDVVDDYNSQSKDWGLKRDQWNAEIGKLYAEYSVARKEKWAKLNRTMTGIFNNLFDTVSAQPEVPRPREVPFAQPGRRRLGQPISSQ